jgi:hypothetical protein
MFFKENSCKFGFFYIVYNFCIFAVLLYEIKVLLHDPKVLLHDPKVLLHVTKYKNYILIFKQ